MERLKEIVKSGLGVRRCGSGRESQGAPKAVKLQKRGEEIVGSL